MRGRHIAAAVLVLGAPLFLGPGGSAAVSSSGSVVREAVVTKIAPNGTELGTTVEQLIRLSGSGTISVPKTSDLKSYRNLSGFRGASGEGRNLVWKSSGTRDTLAIAKTTASLPVTVRVHYFVDGREVAANKLNGKSGSVKIEVDIDNNSGTPTSLQYNAVTSPYLTSVTTQYIPMQYLVRIEFPSNVWSEVGGDGVSVAPGNGSEIATASGFSSPPLTQTTQTFAFEGRAKDVRRPRMQVFATPQISQQLLDSLDQQYQALKDLYGGTGSVETNLKAIYNGATQLVDGVTTILGGVGTNNQGTGKPNVALDKSGLPTTLLGTLGFLSEALGGKIVPGIGERDATTGKGVIVKDAKGNPTTFLGSLQSQKDAYDNSLIPNMKKAIDGLNQIQAGLASGNVSVGGGVTQIRDGLKKLIASLQSNDPANPGFREGLQQVAGGLTALVGALQTDSATTPGFREGLQQVAGGLTALTASLQTDSATTPGFREGLQQVAGGLTALTAALQTDSFSTPGFREGLLQVAGGLTSLVGHLQTDIAAPDPHAGFREGLVGLKAAVLGTKAGFGALDPSGTLSATLQAIADKLGLLVTSLGNKDLPPVLVSDTTGLPCSPAGVHCIPTDVISTLEVLSGGLTKLVDGLGNKNSPPHFVSDTTGLPCSPAGPHCIPGDVMSTLQVLSAGLTKLVTGLGNKDVPPVLRDDTPAHALCSTVGPHCLPADVMSTLAVLGAGENKLVAGLGNKDVAPVLVDDTGHPCATPGAHCKPADVMSTLALLGAGMNQLLTGLGDTGAAPNQTTIIGALQLMYGGATQIVPGIGKLSDGLALLRTGLTNPEFDNAQPGLDGRVPKAYYEECPACFDPTAKAFDKRTADARFQPGFLQGFELFSDGVKAALPKIASMDNAKPGLLEGLKQVAGGLDTLGSKLQTFDPKNPGLVDGLEQVHAGLEQVGQGIFAVNELGIRTIRGQVGDQADQLSQNRTALTGAAAHAAKRSVLGASGDAVSTTYVFDLAATSTAAHDNTVRGGLIALSLAVLAVLSVRPRIFGQRFDR